jgi:hypothetical protein
MAKIRLKEKEAVAFCFQDHDPSHPFQRRPGLPDGAFSNQKIPILGNFRRALQWKLLMAIWSILRPFGVF